MFVWWKDVKMCCTNISIQNTNYVSWIRNCLMNYSIFKSLFSLSTTSSFGVSLYLRWSFEDAHLWVCCAPSQQGKGSPGTVWERWGRHTLACSRRSSSQWAEASSWTLVRAFPAARSPYSTGRCLVRSELREALPSIYSPAHVARQ